MSRLILLIILSLSAVVSALAADYRFDGLVIDSDGQPLPGAIVKTAGDNPSYATADIDGRFSLTASEKRLNATVSFLGCTNLSVTLEAGAANEIQMSPSEVMLDQVVVTATRTPKTLKDVPVVTRLINSADLKIADATNIQDLLTEELPGLEFSYAMSQETSLNMSGFGGSAVLFLIDGERLAGETMDNVDYNRLNLDNVGRIEVVKGAASALYGSNAVGGVVNIISRESLEPWTANVNARYDSQAKAWRYGAGFSFNQGRVNSQTNFQRTTSERVQLTDAFDTKSSIHEIFGGSTINLKERLVFRATDNLSLTARGGYFRRWSNRSNYDDRYDDYSAGLKVSYDFRHNNSLEVSYAYDQYDKARFVADNRTHDHDYSNRQNIVHGLYTQEFGENVFTAGTDFMYDYLTTYQFKDNAVKKQDSFDLYSQFDWKPISWFNIVGSLRYDYFSASQASAVTPRVATMFKLPASSSVRLSYSRGFRAPTLKEMYMNFDMAGIQMIYGNPALKPEKSDNFNLTLERFGAVAFGFLSGQYNVSLMSYYNIFDRRITTETWPSDIDGMEASRYANEDGVKVFGVDFSLRYKMNNGIGFNYNYSYLHENGRTVDSQFSQPRPHTMTWRLSYNRQLSRYYGFDASLSGRYLSKPDSKSETDRAYSLWKLTLQQRVYKGISVNFNIDNLFGYVPKVYYWNSPLTTGRSYAVGLSVDVETLLKK